MARHDSAYVSGSPEPYTESSGRAGVSDSLIAGLEGSPRARGVRLLISLAAGAAVGLALSGTAGQAAVFPVLGATAFIGGLLSTWSPCGYSSLSLLRPGEPYTLRSLAEWFPALAAHALGYLAGGLVLGAALGLLGWGLPTGALSTWALPLLGLLAVGYALHQAGFVSMPYPQRRAQVPHQARLQLPVWQTGLLYGWQLGLNFVTYVRTPILYLVVLAAVFSGSVGISVALVLILNLGRFLPMLINLLPLHDWSVQRWLANNDRNAISADALTLSFSGAMLIVLGL